MLESLTRSPAVVKYYRLVDLLSNTMHAAMQPRIFDVELIVHCIYVLANPCVPSLDYKKTDHYPPLF